ncbi:putative ester cyclase [Paenarthrobacter nicotinovorans]|uniref:ester cyclase n=1 Tax=Micrococcaceae TaxID=1268 RepID=UPI0008773FDA|nr:MULTISPECIES: ester cyclase [Micrococcaceae]MDR6435046.1 putative ester cyclase [Paenarthrobacter nicotinovorans]SCZ58999.1 Predicted ester cyclase [Arthrobacter sp. UNCCL28]
MTDELRERMNRFVEFINTADEQIGDEIISPSAIFHVPFLPEPVQGPSGYLQIIGIMRQAFPDVQWSLEETVIEGNTVAARFTLRGTHQGEFLGIAATGKAIQAQAMNIYRFVDSQISEEHGLPDLFGLTMQIRPADG